MLQKILAAHFKHTDPVFCYKQIQHYLQLQLSGKFRRFDYGEDNLRIYNTSNPPDYQLSNVKVPLYIYLADEDYLAVPKVHNTLNLFMTLYLIKILIF